MKVYNISTLSRLRLRWVAYTLFSYLIIACLAKLLFGIQDLEYAMQWVLQASAVMLIQVVSLWRILPLNHRHGESESPLPHFGPGNLMTLTRGTLIAMLSGFLFLGQLKVFWAWLPAILYIISDITDFLDGYLARITNTTTRLGETLDMNHDALGVLVVTIIAFQYGNVPWWYLPFGFARYFFLLGLFIHQRKGRPVHPLKPSDTRRLFAGLQMGFITVMLFPVVGPPSTIYAATIFLIPFLSMFWIDYLQVTGQEDKFVFWQTWNLKPLYIWLNDWMPLILRGLITLIYANQLRTLSLVYHPIDLAVPEFTRLIFLGLSVLFPVLISLGVLARTSAILALITTGIQLQWLNFNLAYGLLIFSLIYILFVGSGKYALWNPEEWLIHNRPGQKKSS